MKETKEKVFYTECGDVELKVEYTEVIERFPVTIEEGHGYHAINNDNLKIILTEVNVMIPNGKPINILDNLNYHQKDYIIDHILTDYA